MWQALVTVSFKDRGGKQYWQRQTETRMSCIKKWFIEWFNEWFVSRIYGQPWRQQLTCNDKLLCDSNDRHNSWFEYWAYDNSWDYTSKSTYYGMLVCNKHDCPLFIVTNRSLIKEVLVNMLQGYISCLAVSVALHAFLCSTFITGYSRRIKMEFI